MWQFIGLDLHITTLEGYNTARLPSVGIVCSVQNTRTNMFTNFSFNIHSWKLILEHETTPCSCYTAYPLWALHFIYLFISYIDIMPLASQPLRLNIYCSAGKHFIAHYFVAWQNTWHYKKCHPLSHAVSRFIASWGWNTNTIYIVSNWAVR